MISCAHSRGLTYPITFHLELRNVSLSSCSLRGFPLLHEARDIALQVRSTDYHRIIIRGARDRLMPLTKGLICISVVSSSWDVSIYKFFQF
jgi:hypothetical protein